MKKALKTLLCLVLCLCFVSVLAPAPVVSNADALTFGIDSVNGSQWTTGGSTLWTTGTWTAQYWVVMKASKVSYNVYKVTQIYGIGVKSVAVSGTDIIVCVHNQHADFAKASGVAVGDVLSLYNINLNTGSASGAYVRVSSSYGLTLSQGSALKIDRSKNIIENIGFGSTAANLKTHITEATSSITVADKSGNAVADNTVLGTGFTVKCGSGTSYKLVVAGDINGDAAISSSDYLATMSHVSGSNVLENHQLLAADVDRSGSVSSTDYISVLTFIQGVSNMSVSKLPNMAKTEPGVITKPVVTLNYHSALYKASEVSGTHNNTIISNGKLTLASGATSGTFTTATQNIGTFKTMLMSWNAQTNGAKISMAVSYELTNGAWSGYLDWGTWSSASGVSGSRNNSNTYGSVDIDTLTVSSGYTTTGNIKLRCTLTRVNGNAPLVDNFAVSTPQMAKKQNPASYSIPTAYQNNVPCRSQVASENGSIGNVICSPTSTAMALEHMGTKVTSLTAAKAMYDNVWGAYGNWSFACAYAGEHGYVAYLDCYDVEMMKYALSQGCVIGCSTMLTSSGHIVLMSGYKVVNGVEYFVCNDPNINSASTSRTDYTVEYFESKWLKSSFNNLGVVYVFQRTHDLNS